MKQVFYKGLLALTIAFGMTSCDKNDVGELDGPMASVKGITSKVSFGESDHAFSDKTSESGKSHVGFSHIYSSVDQSLQITDSDNAIVWSGSYGVNAIGSGLTADAGFDTPIVLQNGNYDAQSMNEGGDGIGYLPYSSSANFDLDSDTGVIELQSVLGKGFLIVNSEGAVAGSRVSGVVATMQAGADSAAGSAISLINDTDGTNDFYGYLVSGMYDVAISYTLDSETMVINETQWIGLGAAYTINLALQADTPIDVITSRVETSVVTSTEAALSDGAGRDINGDLDMFDVVERELSVTVTLTNDVESSRSEAFVSIPWAVIENYSAAGFGESSTGGPTDGVVDADGDGFNSDVDLNDNDDTIGDQAAEDLKAQAAQDELDRIAAELAATPDTLSDYGAWLPATAGADVAVIAQTRTRTVLTVNGDADTDLVLSESRNFDNPDYDSGVDRIDFGGWVGDAPEAQLIAYGDSVVSTSTAASNVEMVTRTTTTQRNSVVAAYNQTRGYTVITVGLPDAIAPVPAAADLAQTIAEVSVPGAALVETEEVTNPDYEEPSDEATTGVVTLENTGQGVAASLATLTIDGQASGVSLSAGTYNIVITAAAGSTITREVTITADDISDNAVTFSVNTNTNIVTKS